MCMCVCMWVCGDVSVCVCMFVACLVSSVNCWRFVSWCDGHVVMCPMCVNSLFRGFIGYTVKLVFIPINNIIVGGQ